MKAAILRNENPQSGDKWAIACRNAGIEYSIINLSAHDWLNKIKNIEFDFCLSRPPGLLSHYKNLYDERLFIICKVLNKPTYPSYEECYIYENKKLLSYFLAARNIPHPRTYVMYNKQEAFGFIKSAKLPIVAKTSIGASGSGVSIIKTRQHAKRYIRKAFSGRGIKRRFGPNRVTGTPKKWFLKALNSPKYFYKKLLDYLSIVRHGEKDFILFQEYVPHEYEWRVVRIGESYFAHKKIKTGDKASGSKGIEYVNPPFSLLDFARKICEENNFHFMAIDLFESKENNYSVNELQTLFGHVQNYIMTVNGEIGRYIYSNNQWIFENGDFNSNESFDLRLKEVIKLYERSQR